MGLKCSQVWYNGFNESEREFCLLILAVLGSLDTVRIVQNIVQGPRTTDFLFSWSDQAHILLSLLRFLYILTVLFVLFLCACSPSSLCGVLQAEALNSVIKSSLASQLPSVAGDKTMSAPMDEMDDQN